MRADPGREVPSRDSQLVVCREVYEHGPIGGFTYVKLRGGRRAPRQIRLVKLDADSGPLRQIGAGHRAKFEIGAKIKKMGGAPVKLSIPPGAP